MPTPRPLLVALALGASLLAAAPAGAAGWGPAVRIGSAYPLGDASTAGAAVAANGAAVVAWGAAGWVNMRVRSVAGTWSKTRTIPDGASARPAVAITGAGVVIVAWSDYNGSNVYWSTYVPRRGWTARRKLAAAGAPELAIDAQGRGVLVVGNAGKVRIYPRKGTGWATPIRVATVSGDYAAASGGGTTAVAVVQNTGFQRPRHVWVYTKRGAGAWKRATNPTGGATAYLGSPIVAVGGAGDALVTLQVQTVLPTGTYVARLPRQATTWIDDGLVVADQYPAGANVATNGTATIATRDTSNLYLRRRPAAGPWGAPTNAGRSGVLAYAGSGGDTDVVVLRNETRSPYRFFARTRTAGHAFGKAVLLTGATFNDVSAARSGNAAIATWGAPGGSDTFIYARVRKG